MSDEESMEAEVGVDEHFEVGDTVLCFFGKLLYTGKIIEIDMGDPDPYCISFNGWGKRYDLWVPIEHLVTYDEDGRVYQKELEAEYEEETGHPARADGHFSRGKSKGKGKGKKSAKNDKTTKKSSKAGVVQARGEAPAPARKRKLKVPPLIRQAIQIVLGSREGSVSVSSRVRHQAVESLFEDFDSNNDGQLERTDFTAILSAMGGTHTQSTRAFELLHNRAYRAMTRPSSWTSAPVVAPTEGRSKRVRRSAPTPQALASVKGVTRADILHLLESVEAQPEPPQDEEKEEAPSPAKRQKKGATGGRRR